MVKFSVYTNDDLIIEDNFIYTTSKIFDQMVETKNAILKDVANGSGCLGALKCQVYDKNCSNSHVLLMFNKVLVIPSLYNFNNLQDIIMVIDKSFSQILVGYLVCIEFIDKSFVEIYDLCTLLNFRKKGAMSALLNYIIHKFSSNEIDLWIGIQYNHLNWDKLIRTYINYGFTDIANVNETPGGGKLAFNVLEMWYPNEFNKSKSDVSMKDRSLLLKIANGLKSKAPFITNKPLYINDDLINYFQNDLINRQVETSGVFSYSQKKEGIYFGLNKSPKNILNGRLDNLTVQLNTGNFNFHTHPYICYTTHMCYIGWPSNADMIVTLFKADYAHMVITAEGIYVVELTPYTKVLLPLLNTEMKNELIRNINEYYTNVLQFRQVSNPKNANIKQMIEYCTTNHKMTKKECLEHFVTADYTEKQRKEHIQQFIDASNKLKFQNIIDSSYIYNHNNIYNMSFRTWNEIKQDHIIGYVHEKPHYLDLTTKYRGGPSKSKGSKGSKHDLYSYPNKTKSSDVKVMSE